MVKLTNLNLMSGSEISFIMRSGFNNVVLRSLRRLKQAVTRSELIREKHKVNIRRELTEFGILQHKVRRMEEL